MANSDPPCAKWWALDLPVCGDGVSPNLLFIEPPAIILEVDACKKSPECFTNGTVPLVSWGRAEEVQEPRDAVHVSTQHSVFDPDLNLVMLRPSGGNPRFKTEWWNRHEKEEKPGNSPPL
jgi:hypothetical protein